MKKIRKQTKLKPSTRGRIIKILGGLIGGGLLINNIEGIEPISGVERILELSSLLVESVLDKTITIIELLIKIGESE